MKLSVTQRVFWAIIAANAIILLSMFLLMQWSMDRGFLKYVNQLEQNRIDRLAAKLGRAYGKSGDWEFLRKTPEIISRLISETVSEDFAQFPPPPMINDMQRELPHHHDLSTNRRFYRLERRIIVLDAKHDPLFGVSKPEEIELFKPVSNGGIVVGYVGLLPNKYLSDAHQLRFVKEQKLFFALVALSMLLVAASISLPLTRRLVRPLKKLAVATSHLSAGRYDVRVPVDSDDEIGHLSRDFNALALCLENNEHARRQFVADISHELRTPLAILRGEIEAILDGIQDLSLESIISLQGEVSRLNRLVDDLYQLALSDVGALAYRKSCVNLSELLNEAIERAKPRLADRELSVSIALPQESVCVFADADRLAQLFDNLIDNSQKYTNVGGMLDITLAGTVKEIMIDFKDSEPGVSQEDREKLFERLYRVEESRSRFSGGAGLGLAICRNIVEAHEGVIEALHSPFGGVWMRITLPRYKGQQ
jgi:two-component system sensor histidine kinase BaeS